MGLLGVGLSGSNSALGKHMGRFLRPDQARAAIRVCRRVGLIALHGSLHEVFGEKARGLSQRGIASFGAACELSGANRNAAGTDLVWSIPGRQGALLDSLI